MRMIQRLLFALAAFTLSAAAGAAAPQAPRDGADYVTLPQAQPTPPGNKIEVIEFFSYGCVHCRAFDPALTAWVKQNADKVTFRRVHVAFNSAETVLQRLYTTLEAIDATEQVHPKVFAAIHEQEERIYTNEAVLKWIGTTGIDSAKFGDAYNSFGMQARVKRAQAMVDTYMVDHWPLIAIDGRYITSPSKVAKARGTSMTVAAQHAAGLSVMDFLVAKAKAEKK